MNKSNRGNILIRHINHNSNIWFYFFTQHTHNKNLLISNYVTHVFIVIILVYVDEILLFVLKKYGCWIAVIPVSF